MPPPEITLKDSERQRCEVWTRVMGYHRPTSSFNIGKQGEHFERLFFQEEAHHNHSLERHAWSYTPPAAT
jgi:hypothetical protein